jgi:ComF family protein
MKSTIAQFLTRCRRGLLPPTCLLCGGAGSADGLDLCGRCLQSLPRADPVTTPPYVAVVCPCIYAYPLDHCIRAFKFQGERAWARVLGTLLALERRRAGNVLPGAVPLPDLVVPVPLHLRRLRERGYNQSADLARFAAFSLRLPLATDALERCRATGVQSSLPAAARAANVAGAFRALRPLRGRHVALVDDVLTTGSTAAAAAAALAAAGAGSVELWVVARSARAAVADQLQHGRSSSFSAARHTRG